MGILDDFLDQLEIVKIVRCFDQKNNLRKNLVDLIFNHSVKIGIFLII